MSSLSHRLGQRWRIAATFAAAGSGWTDRLRLRWAGLARMRPFAGGSLYARMGRLIGREVEPRLRGAGDAHVHLDLTALTDLMILEEIFLDGIYPLEEVPFTPGLVVDCGACAGLFTLLAHGRFPSAQLHLFEPEPANLARLRRNLALNHLPAVVHAAAVGLRTGRASFSGQGFGGHLTTAATPEAIEVEVADLPAFLRANPGQNLLLKIDIEGAEADLLPGLAPVLPPCTALFLETHQAESCWQEFIQPLLQAGFTRREIRRRPGEAAGIEYVEHLLLRNQ
ncbi:MAG TPA: FkbM family methyltransferase [Lacunisphaera sp.]|nr:FkbM family methyltransferase [Lacunisphaera sp.]